MLIAQPGGFAMVTAKKYIYFVSYSHTNARGFGFGSSEIRLDHLITRIEHVRAVERWLNENTPQLIDPKIGVMNYQLLRTEPV